MLPIAFCGLRNKEITLDRKPGTYFGVDLSSAGKADALGFGQGLYVRWVHRSREGREN